MDQKELSDSEFESFALQRIKICRECEHYKILMCMQCGCVMPVKVRFKASYCPIGKWSAEQ